MPRDFVHIASAGPCMSSVATTRASLRVPVGEYLVGSPGSHFFVMPGFVLAGLTMPRCTRLRIGTMIFAQPELNVPITPMTDLFDAYRRAFVAHLPVSQPPVCAVESSQDW